MFPCDRCGACCQSVGRSEAYHDLDRGDGTCRHYDDATHLCRIYDHRPLRCNVDGFYETFLADKMPYEEYVEKNREACRALRRALKEQERERTRGGTAMQEEKKKRKAEDELRAAAKTAQQGFLSAKTGDFSEAVGIHLDSLHQGKRSLDDISHYKTHPDCYDTNIKQQAGFSAEVKETARTNAERAFCGDNRRISRTDDLGMVNDQLRDLVEVGPNGRVMPGSGVQMKFVGSSPEDCAHKLVHDTKRFAKYPENDVSIMVPSDYYDETKAALQNEIDKLQEQIKAVSAEGRSEPLAELQKKLKNAKKIKKMLKRSKVTNEDAIEARLNPKLSVAKDALGTMHRAGLEGAKYGAAIGGTMATMQHLVRVASGEEKTSDALVAIGKETGQAAVGGYVASAASTGLATVMRQTGVKVLQSLSKSGVPAAMVSLAASSFSSIASWMCGEITAEQCLKNVGQNGMSVLGGMEGAVVGQAIIPIPIVGAILGSIVGTALSGFAARVTLTSIEEAEAAEEHQQLVHEQCEAYIQQMEAYRAQMNAQIQSYLRTNGAVFQNAFDAMQQAMHTDDVEAFIAGANRITTHLGSKPPIKSMDDLDRKMADDSFTFRL